MVSLKKNLSAVILCGGKGERLRPLTSSIPKPLVQIKGRPILGYLLEHLERFESIKHLIVASGHKSEKIEEYFSKNPSSIETKIVNSGDVDIIQRIQDAAANIGGDFFVLYGDTLSNVNVNEIIKFHRSHSKKATITVWPLKSQFGLLELKKDGTVLSFKEKPTLDKWINIGYFYFDKIVGKELEKFDTFEDFLCDLTLRGELKAYTHEGLHITVNTLRELEEAEANIVQINQGFEV